jgi:hypothetical protein
MTTLTPHRPRRPAGAMRRPILLILALVNVSGLVACGGGGGDGGLGAGPTPTDAVTTTSGAPVPTGAGAGSEVSRALPMEVRVVKLLVVEVQGVGVASDLWGGDPDDPHEPWSQKLATVEYGEASEFVAPIVPADDSYYETDDAGTRYEFSIYRAGEVGDEAVIVPEMSQLGSEGQRWTFLIRSFELDDELATPGAMTIYLEDEGTDPPPNFELQWPDVPSGKGQVIADAGGVAQLDVPEDPEAQPVFTVGVPGQGCLPYVDAYTGEEGVSGQLGVSSLVGGTAALTLHADPGTVPIAFWRFPARSADIPPELTCDGPPTIGPVDIDVDEGERVYAFVYGGDLDSMDLLVLPFGAS